MELDQLPPVLLHIILSKLDVRSICAAAATCQTLHSCASQVLPHLENFCITDVPLSGQDLKQLLSSNQTLHRLEVDCNNLKEEDIELVTKPQLQELVLQNCHKLSPRLLVEIGHCCINLRSLSLELCWHDDRRAVIGYRAAFEKMLHGVPCLESLTVYMEGRQFDTRAFGTIPRFVGPSLKALHIRSMAERDARQLVNVSWDGTKSSHPHQAGLQQNPGVRTVGCQNLQSLTLVLNRITDTLMTILTQNLPSLLELDLQDEPLEDPSLAFDLSNWGVQQVGICSKLKRLSLIRSKGHSQIYFKRVNDLGILLMAESCKGLESIRLGGFSQVTDAGLKDVLHSCPNLHTFELIHMTQISDLTFHDLSATTLSLVSVSLATAVYITNDSVVRLAFCKNLQILNLDGCRSVGDDGLRAISGLSKLTTLVLNGADISDDGLYFLGRGTAPLGSLSLRGCKRITDLGVQALMEGLHPCSLEILDLSNIAGITDHSVFTLIRSTMKIVDLRLRDCHSLTDASVYELAYMHYKGRVHGGSLRLLDLWNNRGITTSSLPFFEKPFFPRLRWLGLGWHLRQEILETLVKKRPFMQIFWQGCELNCGTDGENFQQWKGVQREEEDLGFLV